MWLQFLILTSMHKCKTVSKRENVIDEDIPELAQPTEGAMTRLLAAKRRSRLV